ncbi:hypothetical protein ALC53_11046 [Atta colombica]|uniref:Uncharacterized protein n=1 Tax=Atta colombica TaxID=520822 RepID=A0A195B1P5_9HYME|nr:hypothetical protein ALC53_11046 [Atta colombica]
MPKGDGRGRDAAVGEGRGGGAESKRRRWRWARGSTRFGKRRARGRGGGGGEAKTLRRSIPSLRATRFRSPAAFMHQERGQRDGERMKKTEKRRKRKKEKDTASYSRDNCGLRVRERVPFAGSAVPQDPKSIMWLYGTSVRDAAQ